MYRKMSGQDFFTITLRNYTGPSNGRGKRFFYDSRDIINEIRTREDRDYAYLMSGDYELINKSSLPKTYISDTGISPLTKAAIRGNVDAVQLLILSGARSGLYGDNPVLACLDSPSYNVDVLQLLLDNGFPVNEKDLFGRNAMFYAVMTENTDALFRLYLSGGDGLNLNRDGESILDIASEFNANLTDTIANLYPSLLTVVLIRKTTQNSPKYLALLPYFNIDSEFIEPTSPTIRRTYSKKN